MRIVKRECEATSISCERVLTHEAQTGDSDHKGKHRYYTRPRGPRDSCTVNDTARLSLLAFGSGLCYGLVRPTHPDQLSVTATRTYRGCRVPATNPLLRDTRFRSRSNLRDGGSHHSLTSTWQWGRLVVPGIWLARQLAGCHVGIRDTRIGNCSQFAARGTTRGLVVESAAPHLPTSSTFSSAASAWLAPADDLSRWTV